MERRRQIPFEVLPSNLGGSIAIKGPETGDSGFAFCNVLTFPSVQLKTKMKTQALILSIICH